MARNLANGGSDIGYLCLSDLCLEIRFFKVELSVAVPDSFLQVLGSFLVVFKLCGVHHANAVVGLWNFPSILLTGCDVFLKRF